MRGLRAASHPPWPKSLQTIASPASRQDKLSVYRRPCLARSSTKAIAASFSTSACVQGGRNFGSTSYLSFYSYHSVLGVAMVASSLSPRVRQHADIERRTRQTRDSHEYNVVTQHRQNPTVDRHAVCAVSTSNRYVHLMYTYARIIKTKTKTCSTTSAHPVSALNGTV